MTNIWCADDTFLDQLIFLDEQKLLVDSVKDDQAAPMKAALDSGTPPVQVLSSDSVDIPLLSIVSIQTDKHDDDIDIFYKVDKEIKEKTLRMSSTEKRDEVYQSLKATFGEKFTETEDAYSVPQASFASLMSLTIFSFLTWGGAKFAAMLRAADDYDISGSKQGLKQLIAWILEFIGPIGVYAVGGVICALCALSLYSRVTKPQVMLILQQEPYKSPSKFKLVLKYLGLFALWYLIARIVF